MPKLKKNSVADQIMKKFYWTLPIYAEKRGLSYKSLLRGYYSRQARYILKKDGINLPKAETNDENTD